VSIDLDSPAPQASGEMSLSEHLGELRRRLVVCVIAMGIGMVVAFGPLYSPLLNVLTEPYCQVISDRQAKELDRDVSLEETKASGRCNLVALDPSEPFTTRLRVGGYVGFFLALPVILWQLWRFVTPGLTKKEKKYAIPFILSSLTLFVAGGLVAVLTLPRALEFLVNIGGSDIEPLFRPSGYLRLVMVMILAFGVALIIPVLLTFLELAGVITSRHLRDARRYAIVGSFVVAAVVTPSQDPYTLLALAVPMALLYEVAIIIGRIAKK